MVEREQGRGRHDDAVVAGRPVDPGVISAGSEPPSGDEAKAASHARFLAALDEVMADHHNVLAALAK